MPYPLHPSLANISMPWADQPIVYLVLATLSLLVALRFAKRAVAPIGALVEVVIAGAVVAFALGLALVLVVVAALGLI